jgi:hypothetical protein
MQAPWTEIGRLQSDVSDIRNELRRKAESHEIHSLSRRLDALERTIGEISSRIDGICSRQYEMEIASQRYG